MVPNVPIVSGGFRTRTFGTFGTAGTIGPVFIMYKTKVPMVPNAPVRGGFAGENDWNTVYLYNFSIKPLASISFRKLRSVKSEGLAWAALGFLIFNWSR